MDIIDARTRPSKRLTKKIGEWYATEQQRKEAAQTMRVYETHKDELTGKILGYIGKGFTPEPGSDYGVAVVEQSCRIAYEKMHREFINLVSIEIPHHASRIQELDRKLEAKYFDALETKKTVVCDSNENLEKLVKNTEKAELEDRKTKREVELVIYT